MQKNKEFKASKNQKEEKFEKFWKRVQASELAAAGKKA
jgi:hypothetical protein